MRETLHRQRPRSRRGSWGVTTARSGAMVGFARAVSDGVALAYLLDGSANSAGIPRLGDGRTAGQAMIDGRHGFPPGCCTRPTPTSCTRGWLLGEARRARRQGLDLHLGAPFLDITNAGVVALPCTVRAVTTWRGSVGRTLDGLHKLSGHQPQRRRTGWASPSSGEMYGFVGANGAGKTTAMRIMLGVLAADSGAVRWQVAGHVRDAPGSATCPRSAASIRRCG